ncbi:MAG: hypothetical protein K9J30_09570 [Bacteroidales bacterium]|nr:hypothetical protein [Bacteroidales bacterium]
MTPERNTNGFAIALAWPATYSKEPGAWYDPVTRWLGVNRYNYYQAGHAALVLIDRNMEQCHYFDFGRYHAPLGHGRVRSKVTDHDLEIRTVPKISDNGSRIENFSEILSELQQNAACHGEGKLSASYTPINFQLAYQKALEMQSASPLPYGPFIPGGSNCSRFVNAVIRAGKPKWKFRLRLKFFVPLTPTPMNNVNSLQYKTVLQVMRSSVPFRPIRRLSREELLSTLLQPGKPQVIPKGAQWLSGEGAGSWFAFDAAEGALKVTRYSPDGKEECSGFFEGAGIGYLSSGDHFTVDYSSNCNQVLLKNGTKTLILTRKKKK